MPFRRARFVLDAEMVAPGSVPRERRAEAAALLRRLGAPALAARVTRGEERAWRALAAYCERPPGDPRALAELLAAAGHPEAAIRLRGPAGERRLVEGTAGTGSRGAGGALGDGELVLAAEGIDEPLRALFALLRRDLPGPAGAAATNGDSPLAGSSPALAAAVERLRRFAGSELPVLILGENGTGKELAARYVHEASARRGRDLVPFNCAGLAESLQLSELFGHARGAFTGAERAHAGVFEQAQGTSLFLDEIGDLPPSAQGAILRALQEREIRRVGESVPRRVDVRVIAATNRDLERMVGEERFRQDLYFRLKVATVVLPPLRERGDDVLLLAERFLEAERRRRPGLRLTRGGAPGARRRTPGRATCASSSTRSRPPRCSPTTAASPPSTSISARRLRSGAATAYHRSLEEARRKMIVEALEAAAGNRAAAARRLGMSRQNFSYLAKKTGARRRVIRVVLRRLLGAIPTVLAVATLVFALVHLIPGDPVEMMLGEGAQPADVEALRARLGLDRPLAAQYGHFLAGLARLDLGDSLHFDRPVATLLAESFPATAELACAAMARGARARAAARRRGRLPQGDLDRPRRALLLARRRLDAELLARAARHPALLDPPRSLPGVGAVGLAQPRAARGHPRPRARRAAHPHDPLGARRGARQALPGDGAREGARPSGAWSALHALRNALVPVVTVVGLQFGALLTGAILTETIFSWPGLGRLLIQAIRLRDYPLVQGCVLLISVTYVHGQPRHRPRLRLDRSAHPGELRLPAAGTPARLGGRIVPEPRGSDRVYHGGLEGMEAIMGSRRDFAGACLVLALLAPPALADPPRLAIDAATDLSNAPGSQPRPFISLGDRMRLRRVTTTRATSGSGRATGRSTAPIALGPALLRTLYRQTWRRVGRLPGVALFSFYCAGSGTTLWRTDGSAAGTFELLDYSDSRCHRPRGRVRGRPGLRGGRPRYGGAADRLRIWGDRRHVAGTRRVVDRRLGGWRTFGPPVAAADRVELIVPSDADGGSPELWASGGDNATTRVVDDARRRASPTAYSESVAFGRLVAWRSHGSQLWVSDGTAAGSGPVTNFADPDGALWMTSATPTATGCCSSPPTTPARRSGRPTARRPGPARLTDLAEPYALQFYAGPTLPVPLGDRVLFYAVDPDGRCRAWSAFDRATGEVDGARPSPAAVGDRLLDLPLLGSGSNGRRPGGLPGADRGARQPSRRATARRRGPPSWRVSARRAAASSRSAPTASTTILFGVLTAPDDQSSSSGRSMPPAARTRRGGRLSTGSVPRPTRSRCRWRARATSCWSPPPTPGTASSSSARCPARRARAGQGPRVRPRGLPVRAGRRGRRRALPAVDGRVLRTRRQRPRARAT